MSKKGPGRVSRTADPITCEVEVIPGLEPVAIAELHQRFRSRVTVEPSLKEGLLPVLFDGDLHALLDLGTVLAVYGQRWFPVPRPKALLGHAELTTLLSMIETVRELHPAGAFRTFRISAAGEDSSVLVRLRETLASETGLQYVGDEGDLLIRLRRPLDGSAGWDVLIRLSPRPLSAREWRVCNLAGALNASVAQAMVRLTRPHPDDVVLNVGCGSATLLIERMLNRPARLAIGCDTDPAALQCAAENVRASGALPIHLYDWDAGDLPMPDACVDVVLADLPFGQLVGSHDRNVVLYPRLLREAARVTIGGGLFAAITQEIRLWEGLVADAAADWTLEQVIPIKLPFGGGHLRPRIYLLRRKE
ncbi:MAG TPA: methyltransferase domain-containing protein [Herpetosiphonaceae bacterium]|nr:methyltransferase domain-containing protein [Herpetosiphonaceae bacterium]